MGGRFRCFACQALITPPFAEAGQAGSILTVIGADFDPGSAVLWDGNLRSTTFINSTQLQTSIPNTDLVNIGQATIRVRNSASTSSTSARTFQILAQVYDSTLPIITK